MKYFLALLFCIQLSNVSYAKEKPTVYVLATGGTIAGTATTETSSSYKAAGLTPFELLKAVPAIENIATIKSEQIANIGSQDMSLEVWIKLVNRINELATDPEITGFVITHGTDTMDETAYFLNLTLKTDKPVVITGAMRASNSLSADGPRNIFNAVACASHPKAIEKGVMILMEDMIFSADDIQKSHTLASNTFTNPNYGPLGIMYNQEPLFFRTSIKKHTTKSSFSLNQIKEFPKVGIIFGHTDAEDLFIKAAITNNYDGIVYAGVGNGNMSKTTLETLATAAQTQVLNVVRASRIPLGPTSQWDEIDDELYNFTTSWYISPQRARILLMLALTQTKDFKEIQKFFTEY